MAKRARISFDHTLLANKALTVELLEDILDELPSDATIFRFDQNSHAGISTLIVESDDFIDTHALLSYPEIIPFFVSLANVITLSHLDMSAALTPKNVPAPCNCGNCWGCLTNNAPMPTLQSPPTGTGSIYVPPGHSAPSFKMPNPAFSTGTSTPSCSHKEKLYQGLVQTYYYCESCGVKTRNA